MLETIQQYWFYVPMVMAIASIIVNVTQNDTDNKYLAMVNKVLNIVAANFNVKGTLNK